MTLLLRIGSGPQGQCATVTCDQSDAPACTSKAATLKLDHAPLRSCAWTLVLTLLVQFSPRSMSKYSRFAVQRESSTQQLHKESIAQAGGQMLGSSRRTTCAVLCRCLDGDRNSIRSRAQARPLQIRVSFSWKFHVLTRGPCKSASVSAGSLFIDALTRDCARRVHRWSCVATPAAMPSCCESCLRSEPRESRELHPAQKQCLTPTQHRSLSRRSDAAACEPVRGQWLLLEQSDLWTNALAPYCKCTTLTLTCLQGCCRHCNVHLSICVPELVSILRQEPCRWNNKEMKMLLQGERIYSAGVWEAGGVRNADAVRFHTRAFDNLGIGCPPPSHPPSLSSWCGAFLG